MGLNRRQISIFFVFFFLSFGAVHAAIDVAPPLEEPNIESWIDRSFIRHLPDLIVEEAKSPQHSNSKLFVHFLNASAKRIIGHIVSAGELLEKLNHRPADFRDRNKVFHHAFRDTDKLDSQSAYRELDAAVYLYADALLKIRAAHMRAWTEDSLNPPPPKKSSLFGRLAGLPTDPAYSGLGILAFIMAGAVPVDAHQIAAESTNQPYTFIPDLKTPPLDGIGAYFVEILLPILNQQRIHLQPRARHILDSLTKVRTLEQVRILGAGTCAWYL